MSKHKPEPVTFWFNCFAPFGVAKYLADNPAQRQGDAHVLVTKALMTAWPCKKTGL